MLIKWGALVTDGRNKIGGHVASKNRSGAYLRTKVTPVNRQSVAQSNVRSRLASISQAWRVLTAAQRGAWNSAISDYKKTDIFGDIQTPSGFNLFQKVNNNIMALGGSMVDTPPVVASLDNYSGLSLTYTVGTPALSLAMTVEAGTDTGYKLFATAPQSAGKSFVKSEYRLIKTANTSASGTFNILSDYIAKFGTVGSIGQQIFVKIVPCGGDSGAEGIAASASKISAA